MSDRRVHWLPKVLFLGLLSVLLIGLLGENALSEVVSAIVVPLVGPFADLAQDAVFDWVAFAVAAYNLLKLFPAEIVGEHYDRLFRAGRRAV